MHVEEALGVDLATRGEHPQMGTHNHLLSLGPEIYFEAIAINPDAEAPNRPRWFNLDNFQGPPRLTNWILATDDLDAALARFQTGSGSQSRCNVGIFAGPWLFQTTASCRGVVGDLR